MTLEVYCRNCKANLEHVCNPDLVETAIRLFRWRVSDPSHLKKLMKHLPDYYTEGDENAPLFSEAGLYTLLGKEDARSVLALINSILREAGLDPAALRHKAYLELQELEAIQMRKRKKGS